MKAKHEDFYKNVLSILPVQNWIAFESNPDMSCNTYPVYREMLARGLNQRYKMIWMVSNPEEFADAQEYNVCFEPLLPRTRWGYYRKHFLLAQSRCLISCNRYFRKYSKHQFVIYLGHGSNIKTTKRIYQNGLRDNCDFMLSQAPMFDTVNTEEYGVPQSQQVHLGYPRNDALFSGGEALEQLFEGSKPIKTIMWLPTYRQTIYTSSIQDSNLGLPILKERSDFEILNQFLSENQILLLLKLHPIQERSVLFIREMSNIRMLCDTDLQRMGIQLYAVLSRCDALITDYSSVYYDFLLTGRPIGLTQDDLEEYRRRRGFAVDYDNLIRGWPIVDREGMIDFLRSVGEGKDPYQAQRNITLEQTNQWKDGDSTARVTDFIIKTAGL